MSLTSKVCLVTGASRGVGKGIALQLGQAGATVYITGMIHIPCYCLLHLIYVYNIYIYLYITVNLCYL